MTTLESECIRDDGNDFRAASDERTGTFDALGHRFAVTCTDPRMIALVEEAFDDLAVGGPPISRYHFRRHADCVHISWMGATVGIRDRPRRHAIRSSAPTCNKARSQPQTQISCCPRRLRGIQ